MMAIPKVELHCHLEGAAGPALIRQLADTLFTLDDREERNDC
jgi:adenosine deaminase